MKTLLITDTNLGQTRAYMARALLDMTARETEPEIIDNPNDIEMAIILGDSIPNNSALNSKNVQLGDISRAVAHPELFLSETKGYVKPYTTPVVATAPVVTSGPKRVVAVTVCPTGVTYTFMTAKAIETETKKHGWWVKVETRGSVSAGNAITPEEVAAADLVIVAADIEMDLAKLTGKPMYRTSTGLALGKITQELDKAVAEATPYEPTGRTRITTTEGKKESVGVYRHLLTGVSYMPPMVVVGGLYIALSSTFGIGAFKGSGTLAATLMQIGSSSAFALIVPVLAGYIALSIVDRPGLMLGLIGGMPVVSTGSGFTSDIIASFLAGYIAKLISTQLKLPQNMETLKPTLVIPLASSLVVDLAMIYLVDKPAADILDGLTYWLQTMETMDAVPLGTILDGMMCTGMGGLVDRAVYAFGVGPLNTQTYSLMAVIMVAGMVPPLAMGLTTVMTRRKFDKAQQEGGKAAPVLGLCFISEGAIPFAARDPMRVLPCCIVDGVLTGAISMAIGAKLMAPYGNLLVLLIPDAITPVLGYLIAITAGMLMAGLAYAFLKRPKTQMIERST